MLERDTLDDFEAVFCEVAHVEILVFVIVTVQWFGIREDREELAFLFFAGDVGT